MKATESGLETWKTKVPGLGGSMLTGVENKILSFTASKSTWEEGKPVEQQWGKGEAHPY